MNPWGLSSSTHKPAHHGPPPTKYTHYNITAYVSFGLEEPPLWMPTQIAGRARRDAKDRSTAHARHGHRAVCHVPTQHMQRSRTANAHTSITTATRSNGRFRKHAISAYKEDNDIVMIVFFQKRICQCVNVITKSR